mmetsp:Transcript_6133/g.13101  ORF Transcript_6133/g.13101 Transcript_6133/m.13101 type:complete len:94 (+) Transcript_6133:432-713(+)
MVKLDGGDDDGDDMRVRLPRPQRIVAGRMLIEKTVTVVAGAPKTLEPGRNARVSINTAQRRHARHAPWEMLGEVVPAHFLALAILEAPQSLLL